MLRHVISALKPGSVLVLMDVIWDEHERGRARSQVKTHELAPALAKPEMKKAGFHIVEVRNLFIERVRGRDGKTDGGP
jgi:hypothetical protein